MLGLIAAAIVASTPTSCEVTVYNQGFGFIKEVRTVDLQLGRQTVAVNDVAALIQPATVAIRSVTGPGSLSVLEQNYQYDLISPLAILNKSVGQRVRFIRYRGTQQDVLEGTLVSSPTAIVNSPNGPGEQTYNGMVIRLDNGRIVLNPTGEIEVDTIPGGLISQPTLLWDLESRRAGANTVEVSYVTNGMRWNADYVLTLDGVGRADLQGWVTVDNQSGASFSNANMKLLAGTVNRVQNANKFGADMREAAMAKAPGRGGGFAEESLFEYHLYTLQRPATINNRETKQISLLEATGVPIRRRLVVDATRQFGRFFPNEGEVGTGNISPLVKVEFKNDAKSNLGMPLPQGIVRVYQRDSSGSTQMLGEDAIEHTPKDEDLSLSIGRSFDIVAERKRTNFRRVGERTVEETFEIELRNRKDVADSVDVIERSWGDWKITSENLKSTKEDSHTFSWTVPLKAGEVKKVVYTIQSSW